MSNRDTDASATRNRHDSSAHKRHEQSPSPSPTSTSEASTKEYQKLVEKIKQLGIYAHNAANNEKEDEDEEEAKARASKIILAAHHASLGKAREGEDRWKKILETVNRFKDDIPNHKAEIEELKNKVNKASENSLDLEIRRTYLNVLIGNRNFFKSKLNRARLSMVDRMVLDYINEEIKKAEVQVDELNNVSKME